MQHKCSSILPRKTLLFSLNWKCNKKKLERENDKIINDGGVGGIRSKNAKGASFGFVASGIEAE